MVTLVLAIPVSSAAKIALLVSIFCRYPKPRIGRMARDSHNTTLRCRPNGKRALLLTIRDFLSLFLLQKADPSSCQEAASQADPSVEQLSPYGHYLTVPLCPAVQTSWPLFDPVQSPSNPQIQGPACPINTRHFYTCSQLSL
ncbi:hypothetical protein V8F33_008930 [Rhypophila sp. PSN 637]